GGTGSGAAPEICRIAREEGIFLTVFATMPFSFEGDRRMDQARTALESISRYANAVITFDNDRMGELIVPKDGVAQAFAAADKIISQSIRATMNVVFRPGIIRIGMDDLLSALDAEDSRCLFGYGVAKGDNRSHEALEQALKCPLLDRGKLLHEARSVLVQVAGGDTMTLFEVQLVMDEIAKHVGRNTQILFGTGTDKRLGNSLTVTIISSIAGPAAKGGGPGNGADEEVPKISLGMPAIEPSTSEPQYVAAGVAGLGEYAAEEQFADPEPEEEEYVAEEEVVETAYDESSVFEPLDDYEDGEVVEEPAQVPAYAPEPVPPLYRAPSQIDDEDMVNPIARAMVPPPFPAGDSPELARVEAVTEGSQKIALTRVVSGGSTGRIRTTPAQFDGPIVPASRPPAMPPRDEEAIPPTSEEARQQQEMLQLEPVAGRGRFAKTDPTIVDGEDLDVPTFLRKKK
ncbi:MAG TPA: hypothetical protein PLA50_19320, partial [Bacteroidia bacterium]|nr:hypothetical protein [Bacteroidia bacterium]